MWHLFLFNLQIETWNVMKNARGTWQERQAALSQPCCDNVPMGGTNHRGLFSALRPGIFMLDSPQDVQLERKVHVFTFWQTFQLWKFKRYMASTGSDKTAVLRRGPQTPRQIEMPTLKAVKYLVFLDTSTCQHFLSPNHIPVWAPRGQLDYIVSRSPFQSKSQNSHFIQSRRVPI